MEPNVLILDSMALMHRVGDNEQTFDILPLVTKLEKEIQIPESMLDEDSERDTTIALRNTLRHMISVYPDQIVRLDDLLRRIALNIRGCDYMTEIVAGLFRPLEAEELKEETSRLYYSLYEYSKRGEIKKMIGDASKDILFNEASINWGNLAKKLSEELGGFSFNTQKIEGLVTEVDFSDHGEVEELIQKGLDTSSTEGILRTGYQGLNRMTGDDDGLRRGDQVLIGALQHNYKSGLLLNLAKHACIYNDPYMIDSTKKPLVLHISLENNTQDDIIGLYCSLKENETGEEIDRRTIDKATATKYIDERMSARGYHFKMLRMNPSEFNVYAFASLIEKYEQDGYEIHIITLDYLNMMNKVGCTGSTGAETIRDLFRRTRNICNPKLITLVTAHQFSADATYLLRQGVDNFVKEVASKSYYDGCKAISQEIDLEIAIHKVVLPDGSAYLTLHRGKHRKSGKITPDAHHYYVQRFQSAGAIRDDIETNKLYQTTLPNQQSAHSAGMF